MRHIYQAKGQTIEEQYRDVGKLFAPSIQKSVHKLGRKRSALGKRRRKVAERAWGNLQGKAAASELIWCLRAWSEGAGITCEQAMWLMADNLTGCQTFMGRYGSGIALLHSEEEFIDVNHIELHMTDPHTVAFNEAGVVSKSLVYNDLLPGAGLYGWKAGMIVAVDSLFLSEEAIEKVKYPLLANVVSWIVWRMKPAEAEPEKIVELASELGELIDGYTLNVARKVGAEIQGYKLTLARGEHKIEYLGSEPGSYLRQVNIIDPGYPKMRWALPPKKIWRGGHKYFMNRLKTLDEHAAKYRQLGEFVLAVNDLEDVHKLVQKIIFVDLREAYINLDVGAVCVGLVDSSGTSVSTKVNDDRDVGVLEYTDQA